MCHLLPSCQPLRCSTLKHWGITVGHGDRFKWNLLLSACAGKRAEARGTQTISISEWQLFIHGSSSFPLHSGLFCNVPDLGAGREAFLLKTLKEFSQLRAPWLQLQNCTPFHIDICSPPPPSSKLKSRVRFKRKN